MTAPLPPLQALRAFEAAARHLNYTRAAEELALTHGAISHHIARLERDLRGVRLFTRDGQGMVLTEAGQALLPDVRRALRLLSETFARARAQSGRETPRAALTVSVLPSFAARWLLPRLARFQERAGNLDIAIRPTTTLARLDGRDGVDLAIRYGPGEWPGLRAQRLFPGALYPVCSPAFREAHGLLVPGDLERVPLLRCARQQWTSWFDAAALSLTEPASGLSLDDAGLSLQAAVEGRGVALARAALAFDDIAAGRLVRLFDVEIEDEYGWFVVWREPVRRNAENSVRFRTWLAAEAALAGF